jgi:outer membrane protein TolC
MKIPSLFILLLPLLTAVGGAAQEQPPTTNSMPLSLDTVVLEVLSNNPSLKSARANWEAMKERVPQARAWTDPKLGFDSTVARFVDLDPNSMPDQRLMVEQTLPISGKNRLRAQAAGSDAVVAFEEFRRRELDAVGAARAAFFQYANALVQLELNRKSAGFLQQLVEMTRARYEAGTRPQSDVLSAETELAKLEESAFDIRRSVSDAQTRLNTLMNRPGSVPPGQPPPQGFQAITNTLEKLEPLALDRRPEIRIAQAKIAAARSRLDAARREKIPEPDFRIEGDRYNAARQVVSEVGLGFSINLPWFNRSKYEFAIRENQKLEEAAWHDLDFARIETQGRLRDLLKKVETFHHHTELFHTRLLPLAEQTASSKRLSYETDKAAFLELLSAQRDVQEVESMYWDHLMHYQEAVAELESFIGADLQPSTAVQHQHEIK